MKPTIRTSPSPASCTTAGSNPLILSKSNSAFIPDLSSKNKKPADFSRQRAGTPEKCFLYQVCNLRCTSPPSRYARDGNGDDGREMTSPYYPTRPILPSQSCFFDAPYSVFACMPRNADNYVSPLPGESREIEIEYPAKSAMGAAQV